MANIIQVPQGLQDVVSGKTSAQIAEPIGQAFDGLLKLKISEQQAARDLFVQLSKTFPAEGLKILQGNPGLLESLAKTPMLFEKAKRVETQGPKQEGKAGEKDKGLQPVKVKAPDIGQQVIAAFSKVAKEGPQNLHPNVTIEQFKAGALSGIDQMGAEAFADPENVQLWMQFLFGRTVDHQAEAGAQLQAKGYIKDKLIGLAAEADSASRWLTKLDPSNPVSGKEAFDIINDLDLKTRLLAARTAVAESELDQGKVPSAEDMVGLMQDLQSFKRILSDKRTERAKLASNVALNRFAQTFEDEPGYVDPIAARIVEMDQEIKALEQEVKEAEEIVKRGVAAEKAKAKGEKVPPPEPISGDEASRLQNLWDADPDEKE